MSANMIMDDAYYRFRETGGGYIWSLEAQYQFGYYKNLLLLLHRKQTISFTSFPYFFRKIGLLASNERFLCLSGYWRESQGSQEDRMLCCVVKGNAFQTCPISSLQHFLILDIWTLFSIDILNKDGSKKRRSDKQSRGGFCKVNK